MFGRFLWWLFHDANAPGVVQAFAAIATTLVTIILCWITWRYVTLTASLVKFNSDSLKMSYVPDLAAEITYADYSQRDLAFVSITNNAQAPVAILRAELSGGIYPYVPPTEPPATLVRIKTQPLEDFSRVVLTHSDRCGTQVKYFPAADDKAWEAAIKQCGLALSVMVQCCDITERIFFEFRFTLIPATMKMSVVKRSLDKDPRLK
jgi:hypothetical protein